MLAYSKKTEVTKSIRWQERALTWDDFPTIKNIPGDFEAQVYSDLQFEGSRKEGYLNIYAQMIPHQSGKVVKEGIETEQLLIHEQNHFNITEYNARLFRKEAVAIGRDKLTNEDLQRLTKKYLKNMDRMQDRYDNESKHNGEWPKQRYWELHVAGLLRQTAYYANQDIYSYQEFLEEPTSWFRNIYVTQDAELLTSYPENEKNSRFGKVYHIIRKPDSTIVKFYNNGKPTNGGYFEAAVSIITFPNASTRELHLFDSEGKPFSNTTLAHISRTQTDPNGNIIRTYYDNNGKQVSKEGVFIHKAVRDTIKKTLYSSYFDKNNNPVKYNGVYHELRTMGENKLTKTISYFNLVGKPMRDKHFVSTYKYESDGKLLVTRVKKYDVDGKYALALDVYNTLLGYDERGELESQTFFDQQDLKAADEDGVHKYTYAYDLYGNCTDMRKFNIREFPTKGVDNFHQQVSLYDSLGRTTFQAKYYPNYVLMFDDDRIGATTYNYVGDSIINTQNVDVYGKDNLSDSGVLSIKESLNDKKQVIREDYYGEDEKWAKTEDGVNSYNYKYDEKGNQTEMRAFDSLGKPHAWQEDVATARWQYDKNNNKTKTIYYTVTGELANAVENTTYNVFKYDASNNLIERTNFDKQMKPSLVDGIFRIKSIINRFGNDSIVMNYDAANKLLAVGGIIKYSYNERGVLTSESYFNQNDQATLSEFGIHKMVYVLDKHDNYLGTANYGTSDEKINSTEGVATMDIHFTSSGFVRNYSYYNKNEKPVLGPEGFHRLENYYNDRDEVVRTSTYGTDQKLLNNADGIADFVYQIDKSGRTLRISFYDAESKLVEDSKGIAEYLYLPTLNGLYYLDKQLNADGDEVKAEAL